MLKHRRGRPRSLSNQVVAITGGARGIGHATAQALARRGARVAIGDLDGELADQVAAELGGGAFGVGVDVTDNAAFTAFLDGVEHRLGPLDVLVNNAGIMNAGPIDAEDEAMTARAIAINLQAAIHGARGGAADEAAAHGSHRQYLLGREQGRGIALRHVRRDEVRRRRLLRGRRDRAAGNRR